MSAVDGWIKTQLGEIATLVKGISYASEDYCGAGEGAVFITIKCVSKAGGFKREGIKYFKGSIAPSQLLQPGELLIANTDLTRAGDIVGCPMVVPIMSGEIITMSMDLSKIVEDDAKIDRNFLYYKLMTDSVRHFMKDHASGSTVLHLQTRAVPNLELEIPTSKLEQTKIAEVLLTVDRAIEQTEALIAKQQHIKTGLMQDLLTRGIDEHGTLRSEQTHKFKDSPLGRIPVEWEMVPLLSFASKSPSSFVNGPFGSDLLASELKVEGVPVIYIRDIKPGVYQRVSTVHVTQTKANQLEACNVHYGDILVAKVGDPPCDAAPYLHNERSIVTQDVIRIHPSNEVVSLFLCHLLNSHIGRKAIKEIIIQGTRSRVSLTEFKTLKLPKPNREEQKSIAEVIDSIQQAIQKKQSRLNKLNYVKTALMQDLLTGKKRVTALLNDTEVNV